MAQDFKWSDDFAFGLPDIDAQHRSLFGMVNRLINSAKIENGIDIAVDISLTFLMNYINEHFKEEEELFLQTGYPKAKEHIKLHEDLKKTVMSFKKKFDNGDFSEINKFTEVAKNWLTHHILEVDREYVEYCKEADIGVRSKYDIIA